MKKQNLKFLLIICLLFSAFAPNVVRAEERTEVNTNVIINSEADFLKFMNDINSGVCSDCKYELNVDIDLNSESGFVGVGTNEHPFSGVFEGNKHSITINANTPLFNNVDTAIISNVIIFGNINAEAALVKTVSGKSTIDSCFNVARVTNNKNGSAAGLVYEGSNKKAGAALTIKDCGNIGDIISLDNAAGVIAKTDLDYTVIIEGCYTSGINSINGKVNKIDDLFAISSNMIQVIGSNQSGPDAFSNITSGTNKLGWTDGQFFFEKGVYPNKLSKHANDPLYNGFVSAYVDETKGELVCYKYKGSNAIYTVNGEMIKNGQNVTVNNGDDLVVQNGDGRYRRDIKLINNSSKTRLKVNLIEAGETNTISDMIFNNNSYGDFFYHEIGKSFLSNEYNWTCLNLKEFLQSYPGVDIQFNQNFFEISQLLLPIAKDINFKFEGVNKENGRFEIVMMKIVVGKRRFSESDFDSQKIVDAYISAEDINKLNVYDIAKSAIKIPDFDILQVDLNLKNGNQLTYIDPITKTKVNIGELIITAKDNCELYKDSYTIEFDIPVGNSTVELVPNRGYKMAKTGTECYIENSEQFGLDNTSYVGGNVFYVKDTSTFDFKSYKNN